MFRFSRVMVSAVCALSCVAASSALGDATSDAIASWLQRELVGQELCLQKVQRFCDNRIARMPAVTSAAEWEEQSQQLREAVLQQVVYRGQAAAWRDAAVRVEWLDTIPGGEGYHIRKLRYEALPNLWIPALLYEPDQLEGRVPAILNVNGHSAEGKAYVPKQMRCINQARRGMLALNVEWVGMGQLRTAGFSHSSMNQLDLCGTSGLAPFFLCMKRGLDVLLSLEHADPERVAVTGLSGGGWQTITISALDTRVKLSVPVAGYSSFLTRTVHHKDLGDSEQTPNDLATLVDYTHLTAMMAPRSMLLIYNAADECCFESGYALGPLLSAAHPIFCLFGKPASLLSHVNYAPGTHNYEQNNREALYRALHQFFYPGDPNFPDEEIPCQDEVKTAEQLAVELPADNKDFNSLALELAANLPASNSLPEAKEAAQQWQQDARAGLAAIVRASDYEVVPESLQVENASGLRAEFWRLNVGGEWMIPVTVIGKEIAAKTALLVADNGRAAAADVVNRLVQDNWRVVAIDPFGLGELDPGPGKAPTTTGALFAMTAAAVGQRPLGIQASQVNAVARWITQHQAAPSVTVVGVGPRASLIALVSAGLEGSAVSSVQLHQALGSLKQTIEGNWSAMQYPEIFCFGLLESFDIRQLVALAAPREVQFVEPSERATQEMQGLAAWFSLWGVVCDPTAPPSE